MPDEPIQTKATQSATVTVNSVPAWLACILLVILIVSVYFGNKTRDFGNKTSDPVNKGQNQNWEYLATQEVYVDFLSGKQDSSRGPGFNKYGNDGWELVFARRLDGSGGASFECVFKRPKR